MIKNKINDLFSYCRNDTREDPICDKSEVIRQNLDLFSITFMIWSLSNDS